MDQHRWRSVQDRKKERAKEKERTRAKNNHTTALNRAREINDKTSLQASSGFVLAEFPSSVAVSPEAGSRHTHTTVAGSANIIPCCWRQAGRCGPGVDIGLCISMKALQNAQVYSLGLLRFTQTALVIVTDDPLCSLGPELASRTNDPVLSTVIHMCHVVFDVAERSMQTPTVLGKSSLQTQQTRTWARPRAFDGSKAREFT